MTIYFSYPYPVLGNGNDVNSNLHDPVVNCDISDETIKITISEMYTNHQYIDDLIESKKACWQIRILCPRTYIRRSYITQEKLWSHHFSGHNFEGTVNIEVQVVAISNIENYKPNNLHPDYGETDFSIKTGDILTSSANYTFNVDKDYDPLKAPVSSILKVTKGMHKDGPYRAIFEDSYIIVELSEADWSEYAAIRDRVPSFLHASIVLPVLAEGISQMEKFESLTWAARLKEIIAHKGISGDSPYIIAQEILGSPLQRAFLDINSALDKG